MSNDLIHLCGHLHRKTSFHKEIDMDFVKKCMKILQKKQTI